MTSIKCGHPYSRIMRGPTRERSIELPEAAWLELQKRAMAGEQILEDYVQRILLDHVENAAPPQTNLAPVPTKDMFQNISYDSLTAATYRIERFCSAPKGDEPWDRPFFGVHTNRMFPFVLAVRRLLAELQYREVDSIPYPEFVDIVQQTASSFKHYLIGTEAFDGPDGLYERGFTQGLPWIEYENHLNSRYGWARQSKTPPERRRNLALNHFRSNYLLVNPVARNPGPLVLLGLMGAVDVPGIDIRSRNRHIGLTEKGFKLAIAGRNPLIDNLALGENARLVKSTLCSQEKHLLSNLIAKQMPKEHERASKITCIIERYGRPMARGEIRSLYLENRPTDGNYSHVGTKNMDFSALLSRMRDLGMIVPLYGPNGRIRTYKTGDTPINNLHD